MSSTLWKAAASTVAICVLSLTAASSPPTSHEPPAAAAQPPRLLTHRIAPPPPVKKERPRQKVMAEYRNHAGPLTAREVRRIARAVGFTPTRARQVDRISHCESRHHPRAHTDNPRTGDNSYGLMMINMIGGLGPSRREYYGLSSNEQLLDPVKNLRVAWRMSKGGRDWSPWSCARMIGLA